MFKKLIYIFLIILALVGISLYIRYLKAVSTFNTSLFGEDSGVLGSANESVFKEAVKPVYEEPVRILITSQDIETTIVKVGITSKGSLEAPKDWYVAGWYEEGAKAGEPGNMIIDGHYDTNTGVLAAFGKLKNIKTDDIVTVFDGNGRAYRYKVFEISYIDIKDPARTQIFESKKDNAYLTLITCGGIWLSGHGTYSQRLVVKGIYID